jgi:hypothetical protein
MEIVEIFGFGSFFQNKKIPSDIDLLLLHQNTSEKSCHFVINCKSILILNLPHSDITILSKPEEAQNNFIQKANACHLGTIRETFYKEDIGLVSEKISLLCK